MSQWTTPWKPLQDGEIIDFGYQEFICSHTTVVSLLAGGMTHINGVPVNLQVVDELPAVNAVVVKWQSADQDNIATEWARYWANRKETETV